MIRPRRRALQCPGPQNSELTLKRLKSGSTKYVIVVEANSSCHSASYESVMPDEQLTRAHRRGYRSSD